jgi:cbb3-type cytochrome oxidase cytochrome c subunit
VKSSSLVFLAAFVALSASWAGFVLAPQLQLGRAPQTNITGSTETNYPAARPGFARQGADVYRSLGCVYCHSQQVGQEGAICEVILEEPGTNATAVISALMKINPDLAKLETLSALPKVVKIVDDVPAAVPLTKAFSSVGGKASVRVVPQGPDMKWNWGLRRSVAQDFAYENPVQLGTHRNGPDLANVGMRHPDVNWHLLNLYSPKHATEGSKMPPYRFLFEKRRVKRSPSPDALQLLPELAPEPGSEIVPTEAARALAAYLVSLRIW